MILWNHCLLTLLHVNNVIQASLRPQYFPIKYALISEQLNVCLPVMDFILESQTKRVWVFFQAYL